MERLGRIAMLFVIVLDAGGAGFFTGSCWSFRRHQELTDRQLEEIAEIERTYARFHERHGREPSRDEIVGMTIGPGAHIPLSHVNDDAIYL